MHVADFEARTLARQTAGAKGRYAALVGDLGERVGLVHELGELARAEELLDCRRNRLGVDQVMGHQVIGLCLAQTLLDRTLDAHKTGAELVLGKFANGTHATVAEVIDIVDLATTVAQFDQNADHREDVVIRQRSGTELVLLADALMETLDPLRGLVVELCRIGTPVELHAADGRQVVTLFGVEQPLEQGLDGILGGRLARTHHAVDGNAGSPLIGRIIDAQRLGDVGTAVQIVQVQGLQIGHRGVAKLAEQLFGDLVIGSRDDFASRFVDHVLGQNAAEDELLIDRECLDAGFGQFADVFGGDPLVTRDDHLSVGGDDVELRNLAAQALGHHCELDVLCAEMEGIGIVEGRQNLLVVHADGLHQRGHRHLTATVHAEVQVVLRVKLEVQPRAAVGNDARREEKLARTVRLATVMLEKDARGTMKLGNNDPLGTIDDKGPGSGHERNLAHVHFLLLHLLDGFLGRIAIHDHESHAGTQRRCEGKAALLAFLHVEGRFAQIEMHELEPRVSAVAGDREDRIEGCFETVVDARCRRGLRLQERSIGLDLGGEQIGNVQHGIALGEAFADTFLLGV